MALTIGANIASLRAQRQLASGSDQLSRSLERLASGSRLNRASDDPASLAISSQLKSNGRLYTQAIRNTNDGISVLSIADGALGEMTGIITRVTELAEQAANGTYSTRQRQAMNTEAQALIGEYQRIVSTTKFNGVSLLDSSGSNFDLQVGINGDANSKLQLTLQSPSFDPGYVGTGVFGAAHVTPTAGRVAYVTAGDFNNDGLDDFVSISDSGVATILLLSNGDGTFRASATINFSASGGAVGDFNRDGKLDYASRTSATGVDIYLGDGAGGLANSAHLNSPYANEELTIGDLNGDGKLDILAANYTDNNSIDVFLGNGDGSFGAAINSSGYNSIHSASELLDINHDGKADTVLRGLNTVYVLYGLGNGTFSLAQSFAPGLATWGTLADINNDGYLDYFTEQNNGASVGAFLGNSDGSFRAAISILAGEYLGRVADINGDGKVDITTLQSSDNSIFKVFLGNGDLTFKAPTTLNLGLTAQYDVLADFNGDGVPDYGAGGYNSGSISVILQGATASGSFASVDLTTQSAARTTLSSMKDTIDALSAQRGKLGAYQSRLYFAANALQVAREATGAAQSRISDVDIAAESANTVRLSILQQAASAVLAQANQQPNLVLDLLKRGFR